MAKSLFAAMMSMVLAVAACCLLSMPEACGQLQRNDQQRSFDIQQGGAQNSGVFGGGQQAGALGGQQGPTVGPQFGPGQQPGFGPTNPNQGAFVGNDAQDMRNSFENMSGRRRRRVMFDMMVENLNQMRDSRRQRDARRRRPEAVRVQLRPSFNYPRLESRQIAVILQDNLTRASDLQGLVAPQVEFDGRTAIVSGLVPNEHERAVIARMIALQPGVSDVENRLTVDPAAAVTEPSSEESSTSESSPTEQAR